MPDNEESDPMLTTKPFGHLYCGSCEKAVTKNFSGNRAEYTNWRHLPFKEPNERIANYGKGFSLMLKNLRSSSGDDYENLPAIMSDDQASHSKNKRPSMMLELSKEESGTTTNPLAITDDQTAANNIRQMTF